jgi:ubiquinone/menaquinone biosynthesis C-methylase UbiE
MPPTIYLNLFSGAIAWLSVESHRQPNFDPIARPYRWLEYLTFGPYLERCRFHFLDLLTTHRRALVLGDGDGRFTANLLRTNPDVTIDAIDSSATMLKLLANRVTLLSQSASERLKTVHADALAFKPEGPTYDLIVTHFFLDCFTDDDLTVLLMHIKPHLTPGAAWLVSEFTIPARQPAAALSWLVIGTLYRAFRILTGLRTQRLADYVSIFRQNGFSITGQNTFLGGLLVTQVWRLDSGIKN